MRVTLVVSLVPITDLLDQIHHSDKMFFIFKEASIDVIRNPDPDQASDTDPDPWFVECSENHSGNIIDTAKPRGGGSQQTTQSL